MLQLNRDFHLIQISFSKSKDKQFYHDWIIFASRISDQIVFTFKITLNDLKDKEDKQYTCDRKV